MKVRRGGTRLTAVLIVLAVVLNVLALAPCFAQKPVDRGRPVMPVPDFARNARRPPVPPPNNRPKNNNNDKEKNDTSTLTWDFDDVDIVELIKSVGKHLGKNFDIDSSVKGKVTIYSYDEMPPELAYEILESILLTRGFSMVPAVDGNLIKVVPTPSALTGDIPTAVGREGEEVKGYERLQTQLIPISHTDAQEISTVLNSLLDPKEGHIQVWQPTNTLILTTTATNIRRLTEIIEKIDIAGYEEKIEIVQLEYADAQTLATELEQILSEEPGRVRPTPGRPAPRPTTRPQVTGRTAAMARGATIVGGATSELRIVPDERTNSLIIVGVEAQLQQVRDLVEKLDGPISVSDLHVYPLKNALAKELAPVLNDVVSGAGSRSGGKGAAAGGQTAIRPFEKDINIVAEEATNQLVIIASPIDYKVLEGIIEQLDIPLRQVHVRAIIMEITINNDATLAVELAGLKDEDAVAVSTFGGIANLLASGPLAATSGGLIGILDGTTDLTLADPTTGTPVDVTIPNIPALLTLIQTLTSVEVLSAPSLTTTDNEESNITVGQEVPFITGSSRSLAQQTTQFANVYQQIQREDVGVKLTVEPQITEGEYVKMRVVVEISDTIQSDIGLTADLVGPTLSLIEIEATVVVRDGSTAIIGGLISTDDNVTAQQVPFLGSIPLLGVLFRRKTNTVDKRNLVVFLTPTVVTEGADFDELTMQKKAEYDLERETAQLPWFWTRLFRRVESDRQKLRK